MPVYTRIFLIGGPNVLKHLKNEMDAWKARSACILVNYLPPPLICRCALGILWLTVFVVLQTLLLVVFAAPVCGEGLVRVTQDIIFRMLEPQDAILISPCLSSHQERKRHININKICRWLPGWGGVSRPGGQGSPDRVARGLPTGGQGSKVYVLCAEHKEYKHFRPGTRPGGSVTGVTKKLFMCQMFYAPFPAPKSLTFLFFHGNIGVWSTVKFVNIALVLKKLPEKIYKMRNLKWSFRTFLQNLPQDSSRISLGR